MAVNKHPRPSGRAPEPRRGNDVELLVASSRLEAELIVARLAAAGIRSSRGPGYHYGLNQGLDDNSVRVLEDDLSLARAVMANDASR